MIAVLVIVLANVFISYKWLDKNPNGYTGHLRGRR